MTALSSSAYPGTATSQGIRNPQTAKLDAHDVANRIMRQENYLVAMFNKDLLDLRVPLPPLLQNALSFVGLASSSDPFRPRNSRGKEIEGEGRGMTLTRSLEWNLRLCLLLFLFDQDGLVKKRFLKSDNRSELIAE